MKSFHFKHLTTAKTAIPLGIAISFLFISFFEIIEKEPSVINKTLNLLAYIIVTIHFIKSLWHNYYVSYNKKGVTIRLNRNILKERSYQFKHLKNIVQKNNFIIFTYRENPEELDLTEFSSKSITILMNILTQQK